MRLRKWVLTTMLCGGCIMAAPGPAAAAVHGGLAKPDSNWAVMKLDSKALDGEDYCALARRYDNDFVLTLARNNNDKASIAIDFQRTLLDNTQDYNVTLDPGFGKAREFNIRPVSDKALVIRLGQDYAFLDAMSRSKKLVVNISDRELGFQIPDFASGQDKLSDCLASLTEEPAAGRAKEVERVQAIPPSPREEMLTPAPSKQKTVKAGKSVSPASGNDHETLARLKQENMKLRSQLRAARQNAGEPGQAALVSELSQEVDMLQQENEALKASSQGAKTQLSGNEKSALLTRQQMTDLKESNAKLKLELAAQQDQNRLLTSKLAEVSPAAGEQQAQTDSALVADLRAQLENTERSYQDKINDFEKDLAQSEQKYEALARQLAMQKTSGGSEGDAQLAELHEKLSSEKQEMDSLKADLKQTKDKAEALRIENQQLRVSLTQKQPGGESGTRARELQERLELINEEKRRMDEIIERQKQELAVLSSSGPSSASADTSEMHREIAELRRENMRLRHQIRVSGRSDSGDTVAEVNTGQLEELKEKLAMLERENAHLRSGPGDRSAESETLDFGQSSGQQAEALSKLKAELDGIRQDNQQLELALEEARMKNETLAMQLDDRGGTASGSPATNLETDNEQVAALQAKLKAQESDFNLLQERIASLQAEKNVHKTAIDSLREEVDSLEELNKDLRLQLEEKENIAVLKPETKDLAAKISKLEAELAFVREERDRLAGKVDAVRQGNGGSALSISSANWDLEKATRRYNEAEREIRRLGQQLEMAQNQCSQEKQELESMLFDPEIAEREQVSRLIEMEQAVEQCEARLAQTEHNKIALTPEPAAVSQDTMRQNQEFARLQKRARLLEDELNNRIKVNAEMQNRMQLMREEIEESRVVETSTRRVQPVEKISMSGTKGDRNRVTYVPESMHSDDTSADWSPSLARIEPAAGVSAMELPQDTGSARGEGMNDPVKPAAYTKPQNNHGTGGTGSFIKPQDVEKMLSQAGVDLKDPVDIKRTGTDSVSYSWSGGRVYGQLEQSPANGAPFPDLIRRYINKTQQKCSGEFAAIPGPSAPGNDDIASYEIACVDGSVSASASVMFYRNEGLFTAIAHETDVEHMDVAINIRDRLVSLFSSGRLASR